MAYFVSFFSVRRPILELHEDVLMLFLLVRIYYNNLYTFPARPAWPEHQPERLIQETHELSHRPRR